MSTSRPFRALATGAAAAAVLAMGSPLARAATPGVTPSSVSVNLNPGASTMINKSVQTAEVPPNPDIVIVSDTTGSMAGPIGNVQANATSIISNVRGSQPTSFFGAAEFKDQAHCGSDPFDVKLDQALTSNDAAVVAGIGMWSAGGGCDTPENWLRALDFLATDPSVGFRTGSTRIIVLFGDAPAHDDGTPSLSGTIADLQAAGIRTVFVNVGDLDGFGQATAIANATGGVLLSGSSSDVSSAILAGIKAIPVTVTPSAACDSKLTASFDSPSQTVTSGSVASFVETLTLASDAPQGSTLNCTIKFLVDGNDQGAAFVETVAIKVNDVTPPTAACVQTTNPSGKNVPTAGPGAGKSGQNPDGFYKISATDNLDPNPAVYVRDTGTGTVFGPYTSGTKIKYTQDTSATLSAELMGGGIIHIIGKGDAETFAVDASGNVSAGQSCLVPQPPK